MIPKVIHYCWFGCNPLPKMAIKCIASWKKFSPDYEIVEWNEKNFDVNLIAYTSQAYKSKKYAFVSDYVRFYVLYHYGGVYMDIDVEVIKPLDNFLSNAMFVGFETFDRVNPGLILGAEQGNFLLNHILVVYSLKEFSYIGQDTETVVDILTSALEENGLKLNNRQQNINGVMVYPTEYFSPINFFTGERNFTKSTHSIHHYAATWTPFFSRYKMKVLKFSLFRFIYRKIKNI